jgi:hypothetical protein
MPDIVWDFGVVLKFRDVDAGHVTFLFDAPKVHTTPSDIALSVMTRWLNLEVIQSVAGDAEDGIGFARHSLRVSRVVPWGQ